MRAWSWRTVAALGGLLGLVAVVAVAAAGRAPGGGESRPSAHAPTILADYVLSTLALIMVLGLGLLIYLHVSFRLDQGPQKRKRGRSSIRSLFMIVLVLVSVAAITDRGLHLSWFNRDNSGRSAKPGPVVTKKGKKGAPKTKSEPYRPQFRWLPAFVVGSLILGIGGAMTVSAARRRRELILDTPIAVSLADVLAETLDDLRDEQDPRKAVIRAYSRMERTLAARGLPRHETEAPVEYLTRVLDAVQASAHSVRELTRLFQSARFSTHEVDAEMKEDAIAALSGLRAELEVPR